MLMQVHFYLPWYIKESSIYTSKLYSTHADEAEEDAGELKHALK